MTTAPSPLRTQIEETLAKLQLSKVQTSIFLTALHHGPLSTTKLAEACGLPLTTFFDNCQALEEKALLHRRKSGKYTIISAAPPQKLSQILTQLQHETQQRSQELHAVQSTLPDVVRSIMQETKVQHYLGIDEVKELYKEAVGTAQLRTFVNLEKYATVMETVIAEIDAVAAKNPQLNVYEIAIESKTARAFAQQAKQRFPHYYYKFLKNSAEISAGFDIYLFNESVVLIELNAESVFAIRIKSAAYFQALTALHSLVWEMLPNK